MKPVFSLKEEKKPAPCLCFGCTFREKVLGHTTAWPPSPAALKMYQNMDKLKLTKGVKLCWNNKTALTPVSTLIPRPDSFNCSNYNLIKLHQTKAMSLQNQGLPLTR